MAHEMIPGRLSLWKTLRLAWRNLFRNRRRTWITAVTVGVAVLLLNFSASLLVGIEQQSFDNLIYYQTWGSGETEHRNIIVRMLIERAMPTQPRP